MRKGVRLIGVSLSSLCADAADIDLQMTLPLRVGRIAALFHEMDPLLCATPWREPPRSATNHDRGVGIDQSTASNNRDSANDSAPREEFPPKVISKP
jgi:hypothetical protein